MSLDLGDPNAVDTLGQAAFPENAPEVAIVLPVPAKFG
jgi:hypothetical protein